MSITVNPVNDAPLASPTSVSVDEDDSVLVDLAALVSDVETADGDLTYEIVSGPADGDLTGSGGSRTYSRMRISTALTASPTGSSIGAIRTIAARRGRRVTGR